MRFFTAALIAFLAAGTSPTEDPLHRQSFKKIVASYTFVGDFSEKPVERPISDELFWRYPLKLQPVSFPIEHNLTDLKKEMPAISGSGLVYQHINMGRALFMEGKVDDARKVWLSARARFGTSYPQHRYVDYLIGSAFLQLAHESLKKNFDVTAAEYRGFLANASTFLSWAFIVKKDESHPLLDTFAPKGLYNLAAIYYLIGRHAAAFGAAQEGLIFLRKHGKKDYRTHFHRITAEAHIKNRSYLEAVQQLDLAIRQDPDPAFAATMFARVGDIYFNLNNYELAEDAYALANRIDTEHKQINPTQFILRGESLFWLGKFSEAQKMFYFGINGFRVATKASVPPDGLLAFGQLRIADSFVARKELEKAKLEYFRVATDYRGSEAAKIAKVRSACLELPFYQGNNIPHARKLLEEAQPTNLPAEAKELAWACQVNSYTERERTVAMVERVRGFADRYPDSRFLKSMAEPVRTVQASKIDQFFENGDLYSALSFFEANKKALFPKITDTLGRQLFVAYVDAMRPEGAIPFWSQYQKTPDSDLKLLRSAVMVAELAESSKDKSWVGKKQAMAKSLQGHAWTIDSSALAESYANRVLALNDAEPHFPWLLNLVATWSESDARIACDLQLPILSRLIQKSKNHKYLDTKIGAVIAKSGEAIKKADENCFLTHLELEQKLLTSKPGELGSRYLARSSWPLTGELTSMFWSVAELCHGAGNTACATALWQHVRDKGPPASPEAKLARSRLDPSRTELEGLWDSP